MALAKVSAITLVHGDKLTIYLENDRQCTARIVTLDNRGDHILVEDNAVSSKMPFVFTSKNNPDIHI